MPTRIWKALRFTISAGLVWAADFLVFIALYHYSGVALALFAARATGGVVGYAAHKWLTFASRGRPSVPEIARFTLLWGLNYCLSLAGISALIGGASTSPALAKLVLDIVIFASNYFIMSRIFRP